MNTFLEKNKTLLNFGSLGGTVSFIAAILLYFVVGNPVGKASMLFAWLPIVFIVLGVKNQRELEPGGYITYGKCWSSGMIITFVYSSLFAMLFYLSGFILDTSFIQEQAMETMEEMAKNEETFIKLLGGDKYDLMITELENASFEKAVWAEFQSKLILGSVTSLIAGIFLKRKEPFEDLD